MSEKRFIAKGLVEGVPSIWCDNEVIEQEDVVQLLNKQDEEIKKLKRTERSWRKIHCCNKESDNCGIVIEQQSTIKQLQGKIKRLNAFLVERGLAIEYLKWNKECDLND